MEYETKFPASLISDKDLTDVVARMAVVADAVVVSETVYIVSTDDPDFSSALDMLAERLIRKGKPSKVEGKVRKPRGKKAAPKPEKRLGLHSYRNVATGEIVSKQKINRMMAANELVRGAQFINGHNETFMVDRVDDDPSAPLRLVIVGE